MIDIENMVFTAVYNALHDFDEQIVVTGDHSGAITKFPFVRIYESSNVTLYDTLDEKGEHHVSLGYIVEVYTNDDTGRKTHCKEIVQVLDRTLTDLGFTRMSREYDFAARRSGQFRSSSTDMTLFAISCVYTAVAGESYTGADDEIMIYRR